MTRLICSCHSAGKKHRKAGKKVHRKVSRKARKLSCKTKPKMAKFGRAGKRCSCYNSRGSRMIIPTAKCK